MSTHREHCARPRRHNGMAVDARGLLEDGLLTAPQIKARALHITLLLAAANAIAITLLLVVGQSYPPLVPAGVLALSFGLRHAVDADHIAAIDNVTRRLIADGRQPLLTGLWFSLGHSSVVGLICLLTAFGSQYFQARRPPRHRPRHRRPHYRRRPTRHLSHHCSCSLPLSPPPKPPSLSPQEHFKAAKGVGELVSQIVSAVVLFAIGTANLISLSGSCAQTRSGEGAGEHSHGGLFVRCCGGLLKTIDSEWKMLLLGFLFGLGFETSSEIALLALAGMSPSQGIPPAATLLLPLLFATGMSLVDTLDGLLMSWAYGFAAKGGSGSGISAGRRRLFNLYLTATSSLIALVVGALEVVARTRDGEIRRDPQSARLAVIGARLRPKGEAPRGTVLVGGEGHQRQVRVRRLRHHRLFRRVDPRRAHPLHVPGGLRPPLREGRQRLRLSGRLRTGRGRVSPESPRWCANKNRMRCIAKARTSVFGVVAALYGHYRGSRRGG